MSHKRKMGRPSREKAPHDSTHCELRIIGGEFRGRRLRYHGDPAVRPMKHRVREAIFNLISTESAGRQAIDLFAGTGALGLEALSRGVGHATLIEKHVPTARVIEENIRTLGVEDRATLLVTSAFLWAKRWEEGGGANVEFLMSKIRRGGTNDDEDHSSFDIRHSPLPWLVFCSPPYAFYVDLREDMLDLIGRVQQHAPRGSVLVVEADERFDFSLLCGELDVRAYPPAVIGIWRKGGD